MTILSTKRLLPNQRELLLNAGVHFVAYNAIDIKPVDFTLPRKVENIIITSQNGVNFLMNHLRKSDPVKGNNIPTQRFLQAQGDSTEEAIKYFVVGSKTTALLAKNDIKVEKTAQNASELAHFIAKKHKYEKFTYFCGKQRRDELPAILKEAGVSCNEIMIYGTYLNEQSFERTFDGVLFYSPSGVSAFAKANTKQTIAFCIGETTATEARAYFNNVIISNATTIESTIAKAVNYLNNKTDLRGVV